MSVASRTKDVLDSFMLGELLKGLRLTGRYLFARR